MSTSDKAQRAKLILAVSLLLLAGFAIYWFNFRESSPAPAPSNTAAAPETPQQPQPSSEPAPVRRGGMRAVEEGK